MNPAQPHPGVCIRCGTCCRKGGPALHMEDRRLVEEGVIHTRQLYTLREGELAHDPVRDRLLSVAGDIVKVKGRDGVSWTCCLLDEDRNECRIYPERPLECRELECWNPARIKAVYARRRLSRRDLLAGMVGLWELIEDHERRCGYGEIRRELERTRGPEAAQAQRRLAEIMAYDVELRQLMVSRAGLADDMLDFLLGRPLRETLPPLKRRWAIVRDSSGPG